MTIQQFIGASCPEHVIERTEFLFASNWYNLVNL
jgi:hypothetical protein